MKQQTNQNITSALIEFTINGHSVVAQAGTTVAAALLQRGGSSRTSVSGEPRAPLCGMGVCMECRAVVDGVRHVRTCQMTAAPGMKVVTE